MTVNKTRHTFIKLMAVDALLLNSVEGYILVRFNFYWNSTCPIGHIEVVQGTGAIFNQSIIGH